MEAISGMGPSATRSISSGQRAAIGVISAAVLVTDTLATLRQALRQATEAGPPRPTDAVLVAVYGQTSDDGAPALDRRSITTSSSGDPPAPLASYGVGYAGGLGGGLDITV